MAQQDKWEDTVKQFHDLEVTAGPSLTYTSRREVPEESFNLSNNATRGRIRCLPAALGGGLG